MGRFSDILMDHFTAPRNTGNMVGADRISVAGTPGNGPFMVLYLRIQDAQILEATYQTHGCGATIAAGSMLTEMIRGHSIEECLALTVEGLIEALGGVPPDKLHSPALAIAALRAALQPYQHGGTG